MATDHGGTAPVNGERVRNLRMESVYTPVAPRHSFRWTDLDTGEEIGYVNAFFTEKDGIGVLPDKVGRLVVTDPATGATRLEWARVVEVAVASPPPPLAEGKAPETVVTVTLNQGDPWAILTRLRPQDGDLIIITGDFDDEDVERFRRNWWLIFGEDTDKRVMLMFAGPEAPNLEILSAESLARIGLMCIPEGSSEMG